jgi:hypothetical protein
MRELSPEAVARAELEEEDRRDREREEREMERARARAEKDRQLRLEEEEVERLSHERQRRAVLGEENRAKAAAYDAMKDFADSARGSRGSSPADSARIHNLVQLQQSRPAPSIRQPQTQATRSLVPPGLPPLGRPPSATAERPQQQQAAAAALATAVDGYFESPKSESSRRRVKIVMTAVSPSGAEMQPTADID